MSFLPDYKDWENDELLEEIEDLAKERTSEYGHMAADRIMKLVLQRVGESKQDDSELVAEFLDAYNSVGKWYA